MFQHKLPMIHINFSGNYRILDRVSGLSDCSRPAVRAPLLFQLCSNLKGRVWVHFLCVKRIVGTEEEEQVGQGVFGSHAPCSDL